MKFRIADTFTDSLSKLTGEEQKAVKTTAFDLQLNTANPGMQFHKLDKAKDKNFWSIRVSSEGAVALSSDSASSLGTPNTDCNAVKVIQRLEDKVMKVLLV